MKGLEISEEEAWVWASGFFLTEELPKGFTDWEEEKINEHLSNHVWEPFQVWDADYVWDQIENLAVSARVNFLWKAGEDK
jgi:hypothetical protein|tara:strand:+ start:523 stop:762 length:240 start_codon:yes stop_codon:yes gene_type:complete